MTKNFMSTKRYLSSIEIYAKTIVGRGKLYSISYPFCLILYLISASKEERRPGTQRVKKIDKKVANFHEINSKYLIFSLLKLP